MATTAPLQVNYSDLRLTACVLASEQNAMNTRLAEVKTLINDLTADGLETQSTSGALNTRIDRFKSNMGKATNALGQYAQFLREAASAYQKADEAIAKELGGGSTPDHLSIDLPELANLRTNLKQALKALEDGKNASGRLSEATLGDDQVAEAMSDFNTKWDIRRGKLIESVDNLSASYDAIVTTMNDADASLNSSLTNGGK